jgi:hypothetical protein
VAVLVLLRDVEKGFWASWNSVGDSTARRTYLLVAFGDLLIPGRDL